MEKEKRCRFIIKKKKKELVEVKEIIRLEEELCKVETKLSLLSFERLNRLSSFDRLRPMPVDTFNSMKYCKQ